jgi:hypothetical protein
MLFNQNNFCEAAQRFALPALGLWTAKPSSQKKAQA